MTKNEEELLNCVKALSRCLGEHVGTEAARLHVRKQDLCPCWDVEIMDAYKLIEKYKGDDDGEKRAGSTRAN